MNHVACAAIFIGQNGFSLLPQAMSDLVDYEAVVLSRPDGYLQLILPGVPEGDVWDVAEKLSAFVMEAGPDSGGPGYAGALIGGQWHSYDLEPSNFATLADLYQQWKSGEPPIEQVDAARLEVAQALEQ